MILYFGYTLLAVFIQAPVFVTAAVNLSSDDVWLNKSFKMTCTFDVGEDVTYSRWDSSLFERETVVYKKNGEEKCKMIGNMEPSEYSFDCSVRNEFTMLVRKASSIHHLTKWKCFLANNISNDVTINVNIQINSLSLVYQGVVITGEKTANINQNSALKAVCNSSFGRPLPDIKWFKYSLLDTILIQEVKQKDTAELNYTISKKDNGLSIGCVASNRKGFNITSERLTLNVSYPPDGPKFHEYENGTTYKVFDGYRGSLTCYVTGGNPSHTNLTLSCFQKTLTCLVDELKNVTITWIALQAQAGNKCSCSSLHAVSTKTASVFFEILYAPRTPRISLSKHDVDGTIKVILHDSLLLSCNASSQPIATITWKLPNDSISDGHVIYIQRIQMTEKGNFTCFARNTMISSDGSVKNGSNLTSFLIDILSPPMEPEFRYKHESGQLLEQKHLHVLRGTNVTVACMSSGNPLPTRRWLDEKTNNSLLVVNNVKKDLKKTCNATNLMTDTLGKQQLGINASSLSVFVLYPPDSPGFRLQYDSVNTVIKSGSIVNIIEDTSFKVICNTSSNPLPEYRWDGKSQLEAEILNIEGITRNQQGLYTCHTSNKMEPSFENIVTGNSSGNISINVLYSPDIKEMKNQSAVEGSAFSTSCQVIQGNPSSKWVQWKRDKGDLISNTSMMSIQNVSRDNKAAYTCIVTYTMEPTGNTKTMDVVEKQFHLIVFFPAKIIVFSEFERIEFKNVTVVNETGDVSFICTAEANPASDMTISSPQNTQIAKELNKNTLRHTLQNTSYLDAGEYICSCRNNYTHGQVSSSKLILIVRSPPKLSSDNAKDGKVATTLHADITLQFTALDYLDEANKTIFIWFKENSTLENNGSKIKMSSHQLQSNLSITNITKADFGQYGVNVSNSVGQYIHLYELVAKDKPETPKDFTYINNSVTGTSVTLNWIPGFYGGYPQTFVFMYKTHTGRQWQNKSIEDNGLDEMNYTLIDLFSITEYEVKMFSRNREGDSAFTEDLKFTTKAPVSTPIESDSSSMVAVVAGSVSASVLILTTAGVAVLLLIYRKRNNKGNKSVYQNIPFSGNHISTQRKHESLETRETLFEGLQDVDDVPIITNERTEYCNSPEIIEKIDRIKVTELLSYVSGRGEESFEADYQKLPTELQKPCTFARKPENIALNRYNGIYPYDHSRVKLHGEPDFFINACYINGYQSSKSYIASLGPTAKTTNEFQTFWKMVWSEKVDVIVMLTNLREPSGMKCEKYWPAGGATIWYGDVCVSNKTTECFAEYSIRQFSVSKEEERRSLTHLHYTAWPDKTVPEDVTSLIEFRQRMKITPTSSEGPVVVHCSAGIGRTGTLIAIDRLIEEGQDKGSINVFECVENMREQRVKMVQTFEQYMYIYKALVNALTFDCEAIPVEKFNEYVDATNNNMYSMLFQQLRQSVDTDSKADVEARLKNEKLTNKNRLGADIPGSRFRAMLYLNRTDEGSEYINAVYINSFVKRDNFIAAQSPLPNTVADFLTLVFQEDCSCIATMEDLKDPGMTVGQYLPDDKKTLNVGNFKVSSSGLETKHNFVVRKMKIKYSGKFDSGEKIIYHFQYTKWMTGQDTPMNAKAFVQFVNEVKEYANELGEERSHVIVHCLKANERSGLFCALATLMEKIKLERQVNVLNTLRHLRTRRQTAITSMEQLKFCFQATSEYIKMNMLG